MSLVRHQTVLGVKVDQGIGLTFTRDRDEPEDIPARLYIDRNTWIEMGSPEEVTVSVEPGNKLA